MSDNIFEQPTPPMPPLAEQVKSALRAPEILPNNLVIENLGNQIVNLGIQIDSLGMRSGLQHFIVELKKATANDDLNGATEALTKINQEVVREQSLRQAHPSARGPYAKWGLEDI